MKTLGITTFFLFMAVQMPVWAQPNNDRMERELRIAETILSELFQVDAENGNTSLLTQRQLPVESAYYDGFGVVFSVPNPLQSRFMMVTMDRDGASRVALQSEARPNDSQPAMDNKGVTDRLHEFFTRYAPILRELPDEAHVLVTVGAQQSPSGPVLHLGRSGRTENRDENTLQPVTARVQMRDVRRHDAGQLSANAFLERIQIQKMDANGEAPRDMEMFRSILQTALDDVQAEHHRVVRRVAMQRIPGLGVVYHVQAGWQARDGQALQFLFGTASGDSTRRTPEHARIHLDGFDGAVEALIDGQIQASFNQEAMQEFLERMEHVRFQVDTLRVQGGASRVMQRERLSDETIRED
ncbi:MAG: hypothetical protein ACNA78_11940, partial [Balneolaceae bacterium]